MSFLGLVWKLHRFDGISIPSLCLLSSLNRLASMYPQHVRRMSFEHTVQTEMTVVAAQGHSS
jgi:hypothetical protein